MARGAAAKAAYVADLWGTAAMGAAREGVEPVVAMAEVANSLLVAREGVVEGAAMAEGTEG